MLVPVMENSGPAQLDTPNLTSPSKFTVVPDKSKRAKVFPAGTENPLMLIIVHFCAAATSFSEATVPVQRPTGLAMASIGARKRASALWTVGCVKECSISQCQG
jgi:hypothetical protein